MQALDAARNGPQKGGKKRRRPKEEEAEQEEFGEGFKISGECPEWDIVEDIECHANVSLLYFCFHLPELLCHAARC